MFEVGITVKVGGGSEHIRLSFTNIGFNVAGD